MPKIVFSLIWNEEHYNKLNSLEIGKRVLTTELT